MTATSLEILESHSPTSTADSIERYIMTPQIDDPVTASTIRAVLESSNNRDLWGSQLTRDTYSVSSPSTADDLVLLPKDTESLHVPQASRPHTPSRADSENSGSSCNSANSVGSMRSCDSRGSRRGRKAWLSKSAEQGPRKRYFCTFPECNESMQYRSGWTRHEEAVHHYPYHWVCCLSVPNVMRLPYCFICHEKDVMIDHLTDCHCLQPGCSFDGPDQATLSQHLKRDHFQCEGCKRILPSHTKLNQHYESCSFAVPCPQCGEHYAGKAQLVLHLKHCYFCQECGFHTHHEGNYQIVSSQHTHKICFGNKTDSIYST